MNADEGRKFNCYTYSEAKTGAGQLLEFTCRPEDVEKVKEFLKIVRTIDVPVTGTVNISHGGYGKYTRFDIVQHKYAGGGIGYIEVLEIKNPPDGRHGIVLHEYSGPGGSIFYEFKTLKEAEGTWEKFFNGRKELGQCSGFIRSVPCGWMDPWFYAVGDQLLMGDFAFPDVMGDHPVYRFGRKFVVQEYDDLPVVKTCVGSVMVERGYYEREKKKYTQVFWDDGTVWDEYCSTKKPEPLAENELWIHEATEKFQKLLAGRTDSFTIDFMGGGKFIGKYKPRDKKSHHLAGEYKVKLTLAPNQVKKGSFYFIPTPEAPTIEENIRKQAEKAGKEIVSIDLIMKVGRRDTKKKWAGVYKNPY